MQKLKTLYSEKKREIWEMIRYVVAGGLTTLLSIAVSYGCFILLSENHTINGADAVQTLIGTAVSWIVAVIFAFWINRWMVFRVRYTAWKPRIVAFTQFAGARVLSLLLFEEGLFQLLKVIGVENAINRLIVLILVMVFNYVASKFWIFKPKQQS